MFSDNWLQVGYKNGGRIEIINNVGHLNTNSLLSVDYEIWTDSRENIIGVTVDFERNIDDFHYDLPIEEWKRFLELVLKSRDFTETQKLFRKLINENEDIFAFQQSLDFYNIKYDKIAYYDMNDFE